MIKEFLEYVSEGLAFAGVVLYCSSRMLILNIPFSPIDLSAILLFSSFLWSRGYAEYLERKLEEKNKK